MKIVFLHGIGDGNVKSAWCEALSGALVELGYSPLDHGDVIAPQYASLLKQEPPQQCPLPKQTTPALTAEQAGRERWEYERRQAALENLLAATGNRGDAISFPESLIECALEAAVCDLEQANRYVKNERLRGCVLRMVLDELPKSGEVVIVGHSLGSLVAIDVLDHLADDLVVRRLITIGSPAGHLALLCKKDPLLSKFPLSRVMTWANLWSVRDPVPYGRGIAHHFPHALDVRVDLRMCKHAAEAYLLNQTVAKAIGDAVFGSPRREVAPVETGHDSPLDDHEKVVLAALAYAHLLADEMEADPRRQERFRAALAEVQQSLVATIVEQCQAEQRPVPMRLQQLADARRPAPGALLDLGGAIVVMLQIAGGNVIAPYEIKVLPKERRAALEGLAMFLEFPRVLGSDIFEALKEAREVVVVKPDLKPLLGLAAVGGGLLLAGPIGLMMAAPAGLAGGAAIVAALAAFGPGGMVGGLVAAGGLMAAGGGAAGGAVKALVSAPAATVEEAVAQLLATAIARHQRGLPRDDGVWFLLCELEAQIAREQQRVEPYSDSEASFGKTLRRKAQAVRQAIEHLIKQKLAPLLP